MPAKKTLDHLDCAVAGAIEAIGDRWTLLILRDVFLGVRRFDDFHTDLQISRNVLTDRLNALIAHGILTTVAYQDNPPRHEYRLTEKGKDFLPILLAIWRFGDKWAPPDEVRVAIHDVCGEATHMVPACEVCGEELTRRNLRVEPKLDVVAARQQARSIS